MAPEPEDPQATARYRKRVALTEKKRMNTTLESLRNRAAEVGVLKHLDLASQLLSPIFTSVTTSSSGPVFSIKVPGARRPAQVLWLDVARSSTRGLAYRVNTEVLARGLGMQDKEVQVLLERVGPMTPSVVKGERVQEGRLTLGRIRLLASLLKAS